VGLLTKIRRDEQRIGEEIMSGETADWLDSYYEALEFFYWEPQHFRANTNAAAEVKKLDEIAKKSTRAEQVTNHLQCRTPRQIDLAKSLAWNEVILSG